MIEERVGTLDIEAAEAYLDGLATEAERRRDAEVAEMRDRGQEPAPQDGMLFMGLPLVWASLRWEDGRTAEVRFGFQDESGRPVDAWGRPWPKRGALVKAEILLGQLCEAWPVLARDRLPHGGGEDLPPPGRGLPFDCATVGEDGIRLEADGRMRRFGREGVLVLEVLSALADLLADRIGEGDPLSVRWAGLRAATDLPPLQIDGDAEGARDAFSLQTAWYASHLGIEVMPYSLAAVDVHARQVLHGIRGGPEPAREEWDPARVPSELDHDRILGLASEAAQARGVELGELMHEALQTRNMDARQRILYGAP